VLFHFLVVRSSMLDALCMLKIMHPIRISDEQYTGRDLYQLLFLRMSSLLIRIILNLICFIAPIGSLRTVSETLFQRLCLSQTTNERSDLLIVLNEVNKNFLNLYFVLFIHIR
jgi:hypothetical protein